MMGVAQHSTTFLQYLAKIGLQLGVEICVFEINNFDKSLTIKIGGNQETFISSEVAKNILVKAYWKDIKKPNKAATLLGRKSCVRWTLHKTMKNLKLIQDF